MTVVHLPVRIQGNRIGDLSIIIFAVQPPEERCGEIVTLPEFGGGTAKCANSNSGGHKILSRLTTDAGFQFSRFRLIFALTEHPHYVGELVPASNLRGCHLAISGVRR